jgi:hypothetical protein
VQFSETLWGFSKLNQIVVGKRLTFQAAFEYANTNLSGELCILANADIYFDGTLLAVREARDLHGEVGHELTRAVGIRDFTFLLPRRSWLCLGGT